MSSSSFSRHGAIDLSQLAQRAKEQNRAAALGAAGAGARPGASAGPAGSYVVELTEQTFESVGIGLSLKHPVIVEIYSSSRATPASSQFSATLAELANRSGGKFLLGRLDIDTAPQIAGALGVQAVPTVLALIGGQLAPLFQGALPPEQLDPVIDQVLKAAVANGIVGRAEPVAGAAGAEADEDQAATADPRFAEADDALQRGDYAAAEAEFDKVLEQTPGDAAAKVGKAQSALLARAEKLDRQIVLLAAAAPTASVEVNLDAADLELVSGQLEQAFARLIGQIRVRTGADRDRARLRLLELFEIVGNSDPAVLKARRDLMTALF